MSHVKFSMSNRIRMAFVKMPDEAARAMTRAVRRIAVFTAGETKRHISQGTRMWKPPVKTGAMKRGIQAGEFAPMSAIIRPSSATPYAINVHEGTSRMAARPFFDITAEESKDKIGVFMKEEIEAALSKIL